MGISRVCSRLGVIQITTWLVSDESPAGSPRRIAQAQYVGRIDHSSTLDPIHTGERVAGQGLVTTSGRERFLCVRDVRRRVLSTVLGQAITARMKQTMHVSYDP